MRRSIWPEPPAKLPAVTPGATAHDEQAGIDLRRRKRPGGDGGYFRPALPPGGQRTGEPVSSGLLPALRPEPRPHR